MKFKPVQILFFVDGMAPTNDDILAAAALNAHVMFRNARAVPAEGSLEACDGVAGKVPPRYAKAYPTAEVAIEKRVSELASLATSVGDSPAPVIPEAATAPVKATPPAIDANSAAGAGDAVSEAKSEADKPAPGAAPAGSAGSAWKAQ